MSLEVATDSFYEETSFSIFDRPSGFMGCIQMTSHWTNELVEKMIVFFRNFSEKYFRDGNVYSNEECVKISMDFKTRMEKGDPFNGFAILNQSKVIGWISLEYSEEEKNIEIIGGGKEAFQNIGIGCRVLNWIFHEYLPSLDQSKIVENLKDVSVIAYAHPKNLLSNLLLQRFFFENVGQTYFKEFDGKNNDGIRSIFKRMIFIE